MSMPPYQPKGVLGAYAQAVLEVLAPHFPDLADPITAEAVGEAVQQHRTSPGVTFGVVLDASGDWRLRAHRPLRVVCSARLGPGSLKGGEMVAGRPQRLQAASALAAFLNTPAWQEVVAGGDYRPGEQIVLVLESDTFAEIRCRIERYEPPVHVAVYCPPAPADSGRLRFLVLEPAPLEGDLGGDVVEVDPGSTVGAFCARQGRGACLAGWQPRLVARVLAGALLRG